MEEFKEVTRICLTTDLWTQAKLSVTHALQHIIWGQFGVYKREFCALSPLHTRIVIDNVITKS